MLFANTVVKYMVIVVWKEGSSVVFYHFQKISTKCCFSKWFGMVSDPGGFKNLRGLGGHYFPSHSLNSTTLSRLTNTSSFIAGERSSLMRPFEYT